MGYTGQLQGKRNQESGNKSNPDSFRCNIKTTHYETLTNLVSLEFQWWPTSALQSRAYFRTVSSRHVSVHCSVHSLQFSEASESNALRSRQQGLYLNNNINVYLEGLTQCLKNYLKNRSWWSAQQPVSAETSPILSARAEIEQTKLLVTVNHMIFYP